MSALAVLVLRKQYCKIVCLTQLTPLHCNLSMSQFCSERIVW